MNLSMGTNPTRRQPPASLAGATGNTNASMDLSAVMNRLNESPAPRRLNRPPVRNDYLTKKNDGKSANKNCNPF